MAIQLNRATFSAFFNFDNIPTVCLAHTFSFLHPIDFIQVELELVSKHWLMTSRSIQVLQKQFNVLIRQKDRLEMLGLLPMEAADLSPQQINSLFEKENLKPMAMHLQYYIGKNYLDSSASDADCCAKGDDKLRLNQWSLIDRGIAKASLRKFERELMRETDSHPCFQHSIIRFRSYERRLSLLLKTKGLFLPKDL